MQNAKWVAWAHESTRWSVGGPTRPGPHHGAWLSDDDDDDDDDDGEDDEDDDDDDDDDDDAGDNDNDDHWYYYFSQETTYLLAWLALRPANNNMHQNKLKQIKKQSMNNNQDIFRRPLNNRCVEQHLKAHMFQLTCRRRKH